MIGKFIWKEENHIIVLKGIESWLGGLRLTEKLFWIAYLFIYSVRPSYPLLCVAGTGKSHTLRVIVEALKTKNIIVCAPTGLSSLIVNGSTIHSTFGLMDGR